MRRPRRLSSLSVVLLGFLAASLTGCGRGPTGSSGTWTARFGNPAHTGVGSGGPVETPKGAWAYPLQEGMSLAPVTDGENLYVASVDRLLAVKLADGGTAWEAGLGAYAATGPCVSGEAVFLVTDPDRLQAFDRHSGKALWSYQTDLPVFTEPMSDGERVYVEATSASRGIEPYSRVNAVGSREGKIAWISKFKGGRANPVAISGGKVFVSSGLGLEAFSAGDGKLLWEFPHPIAISGIPVAGSAIVYHVTSQAQKVTVYALDSSSGKPLWERSWNSVRPIPAPALAGGRLLLPIKGIGLLAVDAKTGADLWSDPVEEDLEVQPAVGDRAVYFTAGESLCADRLEDGTRLWSVDLPGRARHLLLHESYLVVALLDGGLLAYR